MNDEVKQADLPTANITANFPMSTMVYFQFVFAAITLIITAGSYLGPVLSINPIQSNPTPGLDVYVSGFDSIVWIAIGL
jgi:hypothetical protein